MRAKFVGSLRSVFFYFYFQARMGKKPGLLRMSAPSVTWPLGVIRTFSAYSYMYELD
jgi:hypothetical protein